MNRVLRPALCALAVALAPACGQMGPLVVPDEKGAAGPPATTPTATTSEQKELQPESAPLQVP